MGRQRVEVPVDLELNVNKEDFEKDITIAASKSGKKLEKELGASLEAAKQNIKEFAQLQKEVLSGGTVNKADYEYMRGLAEVSNELIRKYNNIQTAANRMTTTLTPGYKELQEAIELVNQDLKVMNDESYKTRKNIELIENIRGFKGHQAEIKELIALQQQYQAQL